MQAIQAVWHLAQKQISLKAPASPTVLPVSRPAARSAALPPRYFMDKVCWSFLNTCFLNIPLAPSSICRSGQRNDERKPDQESTEERTKSVKEMASFTAPASLASSLGMDFKKSWFFQIQKLSLGSGCTSSRPSCRSIPRWWTPRDSNGGDGSL